MCEPTPGDLGQFDWSSLKTRWIDVKARKMLYLPEAEVNRNHPNTDKNRVPIWRAAYRDDHSRLTVIRYYAMARPTSSEAADFLLYVFRKLGVPKQLYTDNDGTLTGKRMQRVARILNTAFADSGGYEHITHLPHNAQATGKVEALHKTAEEFEKLIGVKVIVPDLDGLNVMADRYCNSYNRKQHRGTGQAPMERWRDTFAALRVPPAAIFDAAFKADEFRRVVNANLTVSFNNEKLLLPREAPFTSWVGQEVSFIWYGAQAETFVVVGLDGKDYEITRTLATVDKAGEFKALPDTIQQTNLKMLKAHAKEIHAAHKAAGTDVLAPWIDTDPAAEIERAVPMFPQRVVTPDVETWAAITHARPSVSGGRMLDYREALKLGLREGWVADPHDTPDECAADKAWLTSVFGERERMAESELLVALDARATEPQPVAKRSNALRLVA